VLERGRVCVFSGEGEGVCSLGREGVSPLEREGGRSRDKVCCEYVFHRGGEREADAVGACFVERERGRRMLWVRVS
jgi:hypothetical protein